MLKAFTKSFAMAGLRLGYGFLADGELRLKMQSQSQPWNVSIPAQEAGCAAFGAEREPYLREARRLIGQEREYLREGLQRLGFYVFPSEANFLYLRGQTEGRGESFMGPFYPRDPDPQMRRLPGTFRGSLSDLCEKKGRKQGFSGEFGRNI